jgi:O-antigen/teichoic acid export membrane protein
MKQNLNGQQPVGDPPSGENGVWLREGSLAILDQGLLSGTNFLVAILLARWLTPELYGTYALAFEIFLLVSVIYGALILEPMSVFGASVYSGNLLEYFRKLLRIHGLASAVMLLAMFSLVIAVHAIRPASTLPNTLTAVAIATPFLLLFWLSRRVFYVAFLPQKALAGSCIYSLSVIAGVAFLYWLRGLSPSSAFLLLAVGSLATGPSLFRGVKSKLAAGAQEIPFRDIFRRHWAYGRWAVANSLVIWLSLAIYYPLLGRFFTLAQAGRFKALMNLASPIGQVFFALSMLTLPYVSRSHHQNGKAGAHRLAWRLTLFFLAGTSLYWMAVLLLRHPIFHCLYGTRYAEIINLLPWVALGSILRMSSVAPEIVLKAMHSPSSAFVAYSAACLVAVLVGVPCTRRYGLSGTLFAWVLSGAASLGAAIAMVQWKSHPARLNASLSPSVMALPEESEQFTM